MDSRTEPTEGTEEKKQRPAFYVKPLEWKRAGGRCHALRVVTPLGTGDIMDQDGVWLWSFADCLGTAGSEKQAKEAVAKVYWHKLKPLLEAVPEKDLTTD